MSFFKKTLEKTPIGLNYIKSRKLSSKSIEEFFLGFSPKDDSLTKSLISKGVNKESKQTEKEEEKRC